MEQKKSFKYIIDSGKDIPLRMDSSLILRYFFAVGSLFLRCKSVVTPLGECTRNDLRVYPKRPESVFQTT